jgi:hypothetical protein
MAKISKNMRITILVSTIAFLIFAFLYLVTTDQYLNTMGWPFNDPYYPRAFGINLLILGVFLMVSFFRNEWIQARILIEIVLVWCSLILTANVIEISVLSLPVGVIVLTLNNTIFLMVLVIVMLFFYLKELKLQGN